MAYDLGLYIYNQCIHAHFENSRHSFLLISVGTKLISLSPFGVNPASNSYSHKLYEVGVRGNDLSLCFSRYIYMKCRSPSPSRMSIFQILHYGL